MAAMTLEPRDPEMSHFIDQYKFERQMSERRDKFGGGTSLPLNSDGYEDRQRFLKEERHKEWAEHQEKLRSLYEQKPQDPVYYRIGTPERGLPIGNYEQQRHEINLERHRDYNKMMKKQRKIEQDRIEQRRRNRPPPAQPQTNQIDYNEARDLANTEDKKAYQDYQGKVTIPIEGRAHIKPPISYEENRKVLAEERKHDYALYQEKKAKEERYRAMRGRPITPPGGGLDVGQYDRQVKEMKAQKTKEYRDMLDQQQKEQMLMKAQRDTEMSVIDRQRMSDSQYVASKPPAGPAYKPKDEEEDRRRQLSNRTVTKPAAVVKGPYYSSDNYETYQAELRRKQIDDYKDYLQKTRPAPKNRGWKESDSGLLLPEDHSMEYKKRELQNERKKEYQEHLKQKKAPPNHFWPEPEPGRGALWLKKGEYDGVRQMYDEERKKEFVHNLEKKQQQQRKTEVPRRDEYGRNVAGPYNGMFHGLGEHGGNKDELSQQRRQEYNDRLDQQYSQRDKPTGRPSWAKDPVTDQQDFGDRGRSPLKSPTKQDHYEQMLHEKRREEAQRRRYDDPEYQEKLARVDSRERGPARDQPRYGY